MNTDTAAIVMDAPDPAATTADVSVDDYDNPEFQREFVQFPGAGKAATTLVVSGVTCGGCVSRLERSVQALPGVESAEFNFSTSRLSLVWRHAALPFSSILKTIERIGFHGQPYSRSSYREALDAQRRQMLRRFVVALVPGMQIMMLSVALYVGDASDISPTMARFFRWVMLGLCIPVVLYSARAFFEPAWRALASRQLNMDVPVSLGIGVAFIASVINTVRDSGPVYYDSAAMFVILLLAARLLELGGRRRAAAATENMMALAPEQALRLVEDDTGTGEERVAAIRLKAGDTVRVLPGDRIPVDGRVIRGDSSVDRAILTGESVPAAVGPGSEVLGGSLNTDGVLDIEVTRTGSATVLSRLLCLAARGQAEKPRLGRIADAIASRFVAFVLLAAAATGAWWFLAGDAAWAARLMSVLVVSCPCALSLATPAALSAGTNAMLERGLLVVRPDAVETMSRLTDVCLDKTGTLTQGRMRLCHAHYPGRLGEQEALAIAATLEGISHHPVAAALREAAGQERRPAAELTLLPGRGVHGRVGGQAAVIGQPAFVATHLTDAAPPADETPAGTVAWLAVAGQLEAVFVLADEPRPEAAAFTADLHALGLRTHMLSGDAATVVADLAERLGLDRWHADQGPADKLATLRRLRREGGVIAMLGDGINDAPVLAGADLAVAVDSGADIAKAEADVVLLSRDIRAFAAGVALARRARAIMRQNLGWAVAYNMLAIPVAAAGMLSPWQAAIGMSVSSLVVVGNSLRLLRGDR